MQWTVFIFLLKKSGATAQQGDTVQDSFANTAMEKPPLVSCGEVGKHSICERLPTVLARRSL